MPTLKMDNGYALEWNGDGAQTIKLTSDAEDSEVTLTRYDAGNLAEMLATFGKHGGGGMPKQRRRIKATIEQTVSVEVEFEINVDDDADQVLEEIYELVDISVSADEAAISSYVDDHVEIKEISVDDCESNSLDINRDYEV